MKRLLTIAFTVFATLSMAQNFHFTPQWKMGDVKEVSITQVEREYENDELISDSSHTNSARIEVLKLKKDIYTLEILLENQALKLAIQLHENIQEELPEYKDLKLIYTVNKNTAEATLQNWKEVQSFMTESFTEVQALLEEKNPESAFMLDFVFMPLKDAFSSKENTEAYMEDYINYLLIPYNKSFTVGDTLVQTESVQNPFNPREEVASTSYLSLQEVNESNKTCVIVGEEIIDLSEFLTMMKAMMTKFATSAGASDSITEKKLKEIDNMQMEIKKLKEVNFDYTSTWVTKIVQRGVVEAMDPKKGIRKRKEVITTTVVS